MSDERSQVGRVIGKQMRTRAHPSFCASQLIVNKALFIFRGSSLGGWIPSQTENASRYIFLRVRRDLRNRSRVFKIQALTPKLPTFSIYPRSKPCLSDKTDFLRVDEFSPQDKILINMRQNGSTTTKRQAGESWERVQGCRMRGVTEGERERRYAR